MTKNELIEQAEALETVLIGARGGPNVNVFGAQISCTAWVQQFGESVAKFLRAQAQAQAQATPEQVALEVDPAIAAKTLAGYANKEHTTADVTLRNMTEEDFDKAHGVVSDVAELVENITGDARFYVQHEDIAGRMLQAADALTAQQQQLDFLKHKVAVGADLMRIDREHIEKLEGRIAELNAAMTLLALSK